MPDDLDKMFRKPEHDPDYLPMTVVMVVGYLGPDGEEYYSTHVRGTTTDTQAAGLIERAKFDIFTKRVVND